MDAHPLRIGLTVPRLGFAGGLERHAHDLARGLRARGHRVHLIHGPAEGRDPAAYAAAFDGVRPLQAGAGRDLDVVYAQKAASARDLEPLGGVPVAVAAHDHDLGCPRSHRYLPVTHAACHAGCGARCLASGCFVVRDRESRVPIRLVDPHAHRLRLAELARRAPIVCCSAYVADRLCESGAPADRVHVVHPVPPRDDAPLAPRPAEPALVVVAQLVRGKGVDLAVDALARLPGARLEIVGDGPDREALEARARAVAPGRVTFAGYVPPDRVRERYDAARVVVVPSRWPEPYGLVGVEALRRGRPVVAADHGGIPEWLPARGARPFVPGSAASLARAAAALLEDEGAGEEALAASAAFSHERAVAAVERLLGGLAA